MKAKKVSLFGIPKEYSENATIHGIAYIFSASNAIEKFIWKVDKKSTIYFNNIFQVSSSIRSVSWHSVCVHAGLLAVAGAACGHQPQGTL